MIPMRRWVFIFLLAMAPLHFAMAAAPQEGFIKKLGDDAIAVLADKSLTVPRRHAVFAQMFRNNFDLITIGRFALGRHWREANNAQQAEYQRLFEKMVVTVYTQRFDNYAGQQFSVKGSTPVDGAAADTMVHAQIVQQDGPPVGVDWRVRAQDGGGYKIIDVMVEGVSMSVTQRSDFDAVVAQGGIDGLLQDMQSRVANGSTSVGTDGAKTAGLVKPHCNCVRMENGQAVSCCP